MKIIELQKELYSQLLNDCQNKAVQCEIEILKQSKSAVMEAIQEYTYMIEDCLLSRDDVSYYRYYHRRDELYEALKTLSSS